MSEGSEATEPEVVDAELVEEDEEDDTVDGEVLGTSGPGYELEPYDPDAIIDAELVEEKTTPNEHGVRPGGGNGGGGGGGGAGTGRRPRRKRWGKGGGSGGGGRGVAIMPITVNLPGSSVRVGGGTTLIGSPVIGGKARPAPRGRPAPKPL